MVTWLGKKGTRGGGGEESISGARDGGEGGVERGMGSGSGGRGVDENGQKGREVLCWGGKD